MLYAVTIDQEWKSFFDATINALAAIAIYQHL